MTTERTGHGFSRRALLARTLRLGTGAAALCVATAAGASPVLARGAIAERMQVLMDDVVEATADDFERGQRRGVHLVRAAAGAGLVGAAGAEFTSGVVPLAFPATHLGLHWVHTGAATPAIAVALRTSPDGQAWSDWHPLTIEAVTDQTGGRAVFAALVGAARARFAQYRATFTTDEPVSLTRMTLTALNAVDGPRTVTAAARLEETITTADGARVTVVTREGWGCDEQLRFRGRKEIWPRMYVPSKRIILHHTATSNTATDWAAEVRAIYSYHARTLGWGDIGYHLLVDQDGRVYEGRHGRGEDPATREIASTDVVAGHVYGHNYGTTGVAALGDFEEGTPPTPLLTALDDVATLVCGRHFIDPRGASDFLQSNNIWHAGLAHCSGHDESDATLCPGQFLKAHLDDLRSSVAARLGAAAPPALTSPTPTGAGATPLSAPASLTFSGFSASDLYCLEGWHKPSSSEDITYLSGYTPTTVGGETTVSQTWQPANATTRTFSDLAAGQYTMHVRSPGGAYAARLTYLVTGDTGTTKPGKRPR